MLAMLQWSKPRILGWNETSEKNVHWSTLRLPHRPQLVVSKSKFWKHVWIYTVWSSAINTISQSSISFTEPPFPLRSQLRRKARNPAISLAPGDSASNGADRCCENKFLPLRDPNSCLIPKLWNIWNEVKQLDTIYMIHLGEKTVGKKMFRPALSCSVKKKHHRIDCLQVFMWPLHRDTADSAISSLPQGGVQRTWKRTGTQICEIRTQYKILIANWCLGQLLQQCLSIYTKLHENQNFMHTFI